MTEKRDFHKVAFLDTNTLHYIGIYLEYAKGKGLFPWNIEDMASGKDVAIANVNNIAESNLKRGYKYTHYIGIYLEYASLFPWMKIWRAEM